MVASYLFFLMAKETVDLEKRTTWKFYLWQNEDSGPEDSTSDSLRDYCREAEAQELWHMGLVAPQHVGSSRTKNRTHVFCIGRQILYHWATRKTKKVIWNWKHAAQENSCGLNDYLWESITITCLSRILHCVCMPFFPAKQFNKRSPDSKWGLNRFVLKKLLVV